MLSATAYRGVSAVICGIAGSTVRFAVPHTAVYPSAVEHASTLAAPVPEGVNVAVPPEVETVPPVAVKATAELKFPVPCTVAVHDEVWAVVISVGAHDTATDVTVAFTVTVADAELLPPAPVQE
jgi:hypothetical protein